MSSYLGHQAPWSERRLDVGHRKRNGNSDRSECGSGSCDASGHSANLYTVLMTLVEGESFNILVGSGSGRRSGSLAVSTLGPLDDWKSKRIAHRNPVTWTWMEDLMRRHTHRRDARNGQRHMLAEDIRMAALEALLPEELKRHGHGWIRTRS